VFFLVFLEKILLFFAKLTNVFIFVKENLRVLKLKNKGL